jgi:hypothetical protein
MKRLALLLPLLLPGGCASESTTAVVPAGTVVVPAQEVNQVLAGLYSDQDQLQSSALTAMERLPGIEQAHRQRLQHLAERARTALVKEKARKLLMAQEPAP